MYILVMKQLITMFLIALAGFIFAIGDEGMEGIKNCANMVFIQLS